MHLRMPFMKRLEYLRHWYVNLIVGNFSPLIIKLLEFCYGRILYVISLVLNLYEMQVKISKENYNYPLLIVMFGKVLGFHGRHQKYFRILLVKNALY